jgi:hypothetical protein
MKKRVMFIGVIGLILAMAFTGCNQDSDDGDGGTTPTPQPNPTPASTTGTLTLYNVATNTAWTITKVEIFEGTAATGTAKITYTTPIPVNKDMSWKLEPMAYFIQITDNTGYTKDKVVNIKKDETINVNYNGNALE